VVVYVGMCVLLYMCESARFASLCLCTCVCECGCECAWVSVSARLFVCVGGGYDTYIVTLAQNINIHTKSSETYI